MKTDILSVEGKKVKEIELPKTFSQKVREDLISKVLETKKNNQPYAPSLVAGKQHSAKGKMVHRRHVWRSGYGRGTSRVPKKIFSQRGSNFNWQAAEVPFARGGMRAHPPKVISMINTSKINKKELKMAFESALSATANENYIKKKYSTLKDKKIKVPFVVEDKITKIKIKEIIKSLRIILGEAFNVATKNKKVRVGQGKKRGRKYKKNAGLLLVTGNKEKLKINLFDVVSVKTLSVNDLAKGGAGRLTIYTEEAIKELEERLR
jgi:large subunit ribosomal protein L4e